MLYSIDKDGFEIIPNVFKCKEIAAIRKAIVSLKGKEGTQKKKKELYGLRNLLQLCPFISELAISDNLTSIVKNILGPSAFPVRALFFDKTAEANWKVPWHQDLTITVSTKADLPGFGPWSIKNGIIHVQPPTKILENMLSIRIHLDDCDETNGALKVIRGSHTYGKLAALNISSWKQKGSIVTCVIPCGGLLIMRPLLLHSSSPAQKPKHRRVVHIEYASNDVPGNLKWNEKN